MSRSRRSACPVSSALDVFGDKWSLLILRDLMFVGKRTYNDFLESREGIATNVLAERLERLRAEGLIHGSPDAANRRRILYRPTEKALDLIPLFLELIDWSSRHETWIEAPAGFVDALRKDRGALARRVRSKFAE